jgi:hypothetical protein
VNGVEIDETWWNSKYAPTPFVNLSYTNGVISENFLQSSIQSDGWNFALLFCYFNNGDAFREYLKHFKGKSIVIIGPPNHVRVTDPSPMSPNFRNEESWTLVASRKFGKHQDLIAIYNRN